MNQAGPSRGVSRSGEDRDELLHFEDLPLGGEWTTRRRTVTQADVVGFMGMSGDYNPLYADVEHARSGHFGEPVVPGGLIAAIAGGLGAMDVPGPATVGLVGMSWRFTHPVRVGDTLRCRWRLNRKRDVEEPRWGLAVWQVEVENQHGQVVAVGEYLRLVERRDLEAVARRRRRSRGEPHLGSKPAPGPLWLLPSSPAEEPTAPRPERRRRRRRAEPGTEESGAPAEVAVIEPAPEPPQPDQSAPRRRRRRAQPAPEATAEPQPVAIGGIEPHPAPAEGERQETRPRRRRRRPAVEASPVAEAIRSEPSPGAEPGWQPGPPASEPWPSQPAPGAESAAEGGWQPPQAVRQRSGVGDRYGEPEPAAEPELAPVSGTD